jgi:peptidyl-prolyl cis-trans isomerase B (cyclophilin B)
MRREWVLGLCALLVLVFGPTGCGHNVGSPDEVAVLETNYGRIVIEFLPDAAPRHVANFKQLARDHVYDGTKFHSIVAVDTRVTGIQGGDPNTISGDPSTWGLGQPGQKKIAAELSQTLKHVRGTVSAWRPQNDPDGSTSQFLICAVAAPKWDGQYSIFGKVVDGMNVVDSICRAPTLNNNKSNRPVDPVTVQSVHIVKRSEVGQ